MDSTTYKPVSQSNPHTDGNYKSLATYSEADFSQTQQKRILEEPQKQLLQLPGDKTSVSSLESSRPKRFQRREAADPEITDLHRVVEAGNITQLVELLRCYGLKKFINSRDKRGSTLLHTAVREGHKDIIRLLLNKGANADVKNAEGKTPLEVADIPDVADILRNSFSDYVPKLSVDSLREITVPEDDYSLFWSVTLVYLYPVRHNIDVLRKMILHLFADEVEVDKVTLLRCYGLCEILSVEDIHSEGPLKWLVENTFRNRVLQKIFSNQSLLKNLTVKNIFHNKNGNYLTGGTFQENFCDEFKTEINKNKIDVSQLKPDSVNESILCAIDNELRKIPDQKKVKQFICKMYEQYIHDGNTPVSYLEIEAISLMLSCNIVVFSGEDSHCVTYYGGKQTIYLYEKTDNHYNFGLVRAEKLIEAVMKNDVRAVDTYVNIGIDNINHKHTGGWTALHFAAHFGNLKIMQLLQNQGALINARDLLNQTPRDVELLFRRRGDYGDNLNEVHTADYFLSHADLSHLIFKVRHFIWRTHLTADLFEICSSEDRRTQLLMFFSLQGLKWQTWGTISGFSLYPIGGSIMPFGFIFHYRYIAHNGMEKSKAICIQVDLKYSRFQVFYSGSVNPSLIEYVNWYLEIKNCFSKRNQHHKLFRSTFGDLDCDFILYSNIRNTVLEEDCKYAMRVPVDNDDILGWEGELGNRYYWKLKFDEESVNHTTDTLQKFSECTQLAKELLMFVFPPKGKSTRKLRSVLILEKYSMALMNTVIRKTWGKPAKYVFRKYFLYPDETFGERNLPFREALFAEAKKMMKKKSERELKQVLRDKHFQLPFELDSKSEDASCTLLPTDFVSDDEIKEILSKLKLFTWQPEHEQLDKMIEDKMQIIYSMHDNDLLSAFSDFKYKFMQQLQKQKTGIILGNEFFEDSLKVVLFSKVKDWDKVYHLTCNEAKYDPDNTRDLFTLLNFAAGAGDLNIVKFLVKEGIDINKRVCPGETALNNAIRNNHYNIAELLVENGADLSAINERRETPLHIAAALVRTDFVKLLIREEININVSDKDGNTPLHYGAKQGNLPIVKMLLEKGSNIDAFDNNGKFVLHGAIEVPEENFEVISLLVEQNATLHSVDDNGWTPLHSAAYFNRSNIIEFLVEKGIDINARNYEGETALHLASISSNKEAIKSLLLKRANIHAVDYEGRTFLDIANDETKQSIISLKEYNDMKLNPWYENVEFMSLLKDTERTEEVRFLLKKLAVDINAQNSPDGETVLYLAIKKGIAELVILFLDRGADIHVRNDIGETVLHVASRSRNSKIVQLLLYKGIDVSFRNHHGETAFHEAARVGDQKAVELIFQEDPKVLDKKTTFGYTALHNATVNRHLEIVEFLLNQGAKVECKNLRGETPLHLACIEGGAEVESWNLPDETQLHDGGIAVVKLLFEHGASTESRDYKGNTPLHVAAKKGNRALVEILLDKEAEVNSRNFNRETPLHLAYTKEVVELLINGGADIGAKTSKMPLHYYAKRGEIDEIRQLLKEAERDGENAEELVRAQDDDGTQPIHLAAGEGHKEVVCLLLDKGASVAEKDFSGLQPVHVASKGGYKEVVQFLMKRAGNTNIIEAEDNSGMLPIHLAAREGHSDVVEFFLKNKISLKDAESAAKITPLHLAAMKLHVTTINALLKENGNTGIRDRLGQTVLHYLGGALYCKHRKLVSKAVEFITIIEACRVKNRQPESKMCLELTSGSKCKNVLFSEEARTALNKIPKFNIILDVYDALEESTLKFAKVADSFSKGESSDFDSVLDKISKQIDQIEEDKKCHSDLEIVLYFPQCLLIILHASLSKCFRQNWVISGEQLNDKEMLLIKFLKVLSEYNDHVDDVINTGKEKLENLLNSGKQRRLFLKMRDLSNKLNKETRVHIVSEVLKDTFLVDVIADYIEQTNPKHLKQQTVLDQSLQKLSVQRALQVIGDEHTIEIVKEHLHDETVGALTVLRNKYLSHSHERNNVFARVMAEHKSDAFAVDQDLRLLIKNINTKVKGKIQLETIKTLCDELSWLSENDKELSCIRKNLQKYEASIRKNKCSLRKQRDLQEISSLCKRIGALKDEVKKYACGGNSNLQEVSDELDKYIDYVLEDDNCQWKVYLGLSFFRKRLTVLKDEILRDSNIGKRLWKDFTLTVNQNPVEKIITYLKKYKKSQVGTEFLIFELRSILTDTFKNSSIDFDKKVLRHLENMIGNRWLRNFLAHLAHGSKLCYELADLPRVVANDALMFMDKGEDVAAFLELSFRIRKDGKRWKADNMSKELFMMLYKSCYRSELLNALKDVTGIAQF